MAVVGKREAFVLSRSHGYNAKDAILSINLSDEIIITSNFLYNETTFGVLCSDNILRYDWLLLSFFRTYSLTSSGLEANFNVSYQGFFSTDGIYDQGYLISLLFFFLFLFIYFYFYFYIIYYF